MDPERKTDYTDACFEGAIRDCEETVKIPKSFYSTWCNELSKTVILEDDYGNIFPVDIDVDIINNKVSANFGNGINSLKAFYNINVGTLVHFKYVGKQTFKIRFPLSVTRDGEFPEFLPKRQLGSTSKTQIVKRRILWESKVIHEKLPVWKTMVIPANVVKAEFIHRPSTIIVKLPNDLEEVWDIIWSSDKRSNFGVLGRGWYNFCGKNNFGLDDKVQFWKVEGDDKLSVKIMRI